MRLLEVLGEGECILHVGGICWGQRVVCGNFVSKVAVVNLFPSCHSEVKSISLLLLNLGLHSGLCDQLNGTSKTGS